MPKEVFGRGYRFLDRKELLTFEEIARLARTFVELGVEKIRITGGEPLLRRDLERLVEQLAAIDGLDLTLTTNGSLLPQKAARSPHAGLRRVTVSLDSLDDATFRAMNDVDFPVERVLDGIDAAARGRPAGQGQRRRQARRSTTTRSSPLARHFRGTGHTLRFIEYMDVGTTNGWRLDDVVPAAEILAPIDARVPARAGRRRLPRRGRAALALPRRRGRDRRSSPRSRSRSAATARAPGSLPRAGSTPACSPSAGHDLRALVRSRRERRRDRRGDREPSGARRATATPRSALSGRLSCRESR